MDLTNEELALLRRALGEAISVSTYQDCHAALALRRKVEAEIEARRPRETTVKVYLKDTGDGSIATLYSGGAWENIGSARVTLREGEWADD